MVVTYKKVEAKFKFSKEYFDITEKEQEVTEFVKNEKTKFVETREEAIKLTQRVGYFYPILDVKKSIIGFGIPK